MKWFFLLLLLRSPVVSADGGTARSTHATLDREAVVATMMSMKPKVDACYARYRRPGLAIIEMTISPDGRVAAARLAAANAAADFADDSPTGACIVDAARGVRFPAFSGAAQTISYPVLVGPASASFTATPPSRALQRAEEAYKSGAYGDAIRLAQRAAADDPQRALRVIGASSCFLGDGAAATAAWRELNAAGRKLVAYVCAKNHVRVEAP